MDKLFIVVGWLLQPFVCLDRRSFLRLITLFKKGVLKTLAGISGVTLGILLVATISATSLGIILASFSDGIWCG